LEFGEPKIKVREYNKQSHSGVNVMKNKISVASFVFFALLASFLSAAKLDYIHDEIEKQERDFSSAVRFDEAFQAAMISFYNNSEHDESVLALLMENFPTKSEAKLELDRIINEENTIVRLVKISDPKPPYGEDIAKNWIFSLELEDTDTIFYAIVSRSNAKDVYNYGFN
jgi:hypothetical protein